MHSLKLLCCQILLNTWDSMRKAKMNTVLWCAICWGWRAWFNYTWNITSTVGTLWCKRWCRPWSSWTWNKGKTFRNAFITLWCKVFRSYKNIAHITVQYLRSSKFVVSNKNPLFIFPWGHVLKHCPVLRSQSWNSDQQQKNVEN